MKLFFLQPIATNSRFLEWPINLKFIVNLQKDPMSAAAGENKLDRGKRPVLSQISKNEKGWSVPSSPEKFITLDKVTKFHTAVHVSAKVNLLFFFSNLFLSQKHPSSSYVFQKFILLCVTLREKQFGSISVEVLAFLNGAERVTNLSQHEIFFAMLRNSTIYVTKIKQSPKQCKSTHLWIGFKSTAIFKKVQMS